MHPTCPSSHISARAPHPYLKLGGGGGGSGGGASSCLLLTDQFAYIPGGWAAAYFTSVGPEGRPPPPPAGSPRATGAAPPLVESHQNCEWPEGRLTCGLVDAGLPMRVLRLPARIARRVGSVRRLPEGATCKPGGKRN